MHTVIHGVRKLDASGEIADAWVAFRDDIIDSTGSGTPPLADRVVDGEGRVLVPGFIDLHGHGGGGHSFGADADAIRAAVLPHRQRGTTRSVISLVTAPVEDLIGALEVVADICRTDPLILGSHLEGPFLSSGRRGAHDPQLLRDPDPDTAKRFIDAARGTLRQVTIAPELFGAAAAIDAFLSAGVVVAVGHTEADLSLTSDAFERGARLLTHAFNAMPGLGHRAPGPVGAAFRDERVILELVLDGVHVHPIVAAAAFAAAPGRIALVTDAMAAAAASDGEYRLGSLDVTVQDGRATLTTSGSIAGSTLTQDVALRNAIPLVGERAAVEALTAVPARALGMNAALGLIDDGFAADAVLLDDEWNVTEVWAAGVRL